MPSSGAPAACAARPWKKNSKPRAASERSSVMAVSVPGWNMIAASTSSKTPALTMCTLPPEFGAALSSAGVPSTQTEPGRSGSDFLQREPGADGRRADQVVAAAVAQVRAARRTRPGWRPAGRAAPGPRRASALNAVAMPAVPISTGMPAVSQHAGQSLGSLDFLVADLGVGVDPVGGLDQLGRPPIDGVAHALLELLDIHHQQTLYPSGDPTGVFSPERFTSRRGQGYDLAYGSDARRRAVAEHPAAAQPAPTATSATLKPPRDRPPDRAGRDAAVRSACCAAACSSVAWSSSSTWRPGHDPARRVG